MSPSSNPTGSKNCIFFEMGKLKKILGKCTFRHANDTQTRGGGTPRHALRGAVVTPLRLRGAVVTPMNIPPDTQWHANDTHQKRVSDQNRGQDPEIKNTSRDPEAWFGNWWFWNIFWTRWQIWVSLFRSSSGKYRLKPRGCTPHILLKFYLA